MVISLQKKRKKAGEGLALKIVAVVGLCIAIFGLGGTYLYLKSTARQLHKTTHCPLNGPDKVTVVLLDMTDPLTGIQQASVRNFMEDVIKSVPKYGKIEFYTISPIQNKPLKAEIALCNPGTANLNEISLTTNNKKIHGVWVSQFKARLDDVLNAAFQQKTGQTSPILESIQSVSVTAFGVPEHKDIDRELVLISDLIQYTPPYLDMYKKIPTIDEFKSMTVFNQIRADLRNVNVRFGLVQRQTSNNVQNAKFLAFWEDYFSETGAVVVKSTPILGTPK